MRKIRIPGAERGDEEHSPGFETPHYIGREVGDLGASEQWNQTKEEDAAVSVIAIFEVLKRAVDRADREPFFLGQAADLSHRDRGRIEGIYAEPSTRQENGVAALAAADIENRLREVEEVGEANQQGLGFGAEVVGGRAVV